MSNLVVLPSQLLQAPPVIPCLIGGGVLPERSLVGLVAQSGAGKTFLCLDMCAHMALCLAWQERPATARGVLYVAGEGYNGLPGRLRAWCDEHEVDPERLDRRLAFMRVPLDISNADMVQRVLDELRDLEFEVDCIVLDTLSSNAPMGFDESDTANMKLFLDAGRALRDSLACTVLFVHHAGHNAERERGSSDFRAALDVMLFLRNDDGLRTLSMAKGRDFEPFEPIRFRLRGAHGSAVLDFEPAGSNAAGWQVTPGMRSALLVLAEEGQGQPMRVSDWQQRTEGRVKKSQFFTVRRRLEDFGYIAVDKKRGAMLTRKGEDLITESLADTGSSWSDRTPTGLRNSVRSGPPYKGGPETGPPNRSNWTPTGLRLDQREEGPGLQEFPWDALEEPA